MFVVARTTQTSFQIVWLRFVARLEGRLWVGPNGPVVIWEDCAFTDSADVSIWMTVPETIQIYPEC